MASVHVSTHPLVHTKLAALRDTRTDPAAFRSLLRCLGSLIAQEASHDLSTREAIVQTPLGPAACRVLDETIAIVPILRAGLGMAEGVLELIPDAQVWHVGLYRDELTLQPFTYYSKLTALVRVTLALVVDPMLATGGSALRACELLRQSAIGRIKVLSLIAAPEGIERMAHTMPDVPIHVGAIDQRLTEVGFIYPGLGDAGDRQFATFGVIERP